MVQLRARLCYLCYDHDGEANIATSRYYATIAEDWFDVCPEHAELCYRDGFTVEELDENDILTEW